MSDIPNTMDYLTTQIVDLRLKGFSFEQISTKIGVDPEEIVRTWREYLDARAIMSPEEQAVLQELRLENWLAMVNDRLTGASKAEDFELVIKGLQEIAKLQGINKEMKKNAEDKLARVTEAQAALVVQAVLALASAMTNHIEQAFEKHRTIKAIKGELAPNILTTLFTTEAQRVLSGDEE